MSLVSLDLQPGWLRRHETDVYSEARSFRVGVAGEDFELVVFHKPKDGAEAFSTVGEEARTPTDAEVLFLIARAFLGSLPQHPQPEPDVRKGYEEFRAAVLETNADRWCPPWEMVESDWREAFAAGVRAATRPAANLNPAVAMEDES